MESIENFKKPDGQIDYPAWNAAYQLDRENRKAKGELCSQCGNYIVWSKGYPERCDDCKKIDEPAELRHPGKVRCPKCGRSWNVGDDDDYELYEEGEHEVSCGDCGHDFEVSTYVSRVFTSPKRIREDLQGEQGG